MKETLFTRHRSTVEPMMIAKDRKATLQTIHTKAVNQAVSSQGRNVVLNDRPPLINISEKELTRKERTTLAQVRPGHCRLSSSNDNDTVGHMEQTIECHSGTQHLEAGVLG